VFIDARNAHVYITRIDSTGQVREMAMVRALGKFPLKAGFPQGRDTLIDVTVINPLQPGAAMREIEGEQEDILQEGRPKERA